MAPRSAGPRTASRSHPRRRRTLGRFLLAALVVGVLILLVALGGLVGAVVAIGRPLPDVTRVYHPPAQASRIYAANGELIASLYKENRVTVSLAEVPRHVRQAVLAIEDARFYQHRGVDLVGIARAVWHNIRSRDIVEGGSTITQQLARDLFLSQERLLSRKLAEMILALEIERRLTKDEILERYLNEVYFGEGAYGIQTASRVYFGKPVKDLTLAEGALLAGVLRAPSTYSPFQNLDRARGRQALVLQRMADLGMITAAKARQARAEPLRLRREAAPGLVGIRAPWFVTFILPALIDLFGEDLVYRGGLEVTTTLDTRLQALAEKAVRRGIAEAQERNLRVSQGALVAIDPRTGHVKAMIGGVDFSETKFNRAWQARRQPGSAFKPFIYVTALANGVPPTRVIIDAPVTYHTRGSKPWKPKNYDGKYRGPITLRRAVEQSINVPAVRMLNELGPDRVVEYARRMGIRSPLAPYLSLALGTSDVTPLEMASAYGVLANVGVRVEPVAILSVRDKGGHVLYEARPERELVLAPAVSYLMTDILKGVIQRGTGRRANIGRPAAGKTGTTDDYRNAWFAGYTPHLTTVVWVGNDDNTPMRRVVGGMVPAVIWADFMKPALQGTPPENWAQPDGLVRRGGELFIRGTEPPVAPIPEPADGANGVPAPAAGPPLVVETPADGAQVRPPFTVRGTAAPGATVAVSIVADGGLLQVRVVETYVPADAQGRWAFEFAPTVPIPGIRYIITLTATAPGQGATTRTLTVTVSG